MNTVLESPAPEAEAIALHHDDVGDVGKAIGIPANQSRLGTRWLKTTVRTIDFRCDDLERTHWKKVWRSMQED
jgi:hypothetical protein